MRSAKQHATAAGRRVNGILRRYGFEVARASGGDQEQWNPTLLAIDEKVRPFSRISLERIAAFREAVLYVERYHIRGAVVECGVWRGGSTMVAALTLREVHSTRDVYLFDTFEGMSEPTEADVDLRGRSAASWLSDYDKPTGAADTVESPWAYASLADVQANMRSTGYDEAHVHFVKGKVEDTVPGRAPELIAVLRLDTDWYESTRHELEYLVPRLAPNGVLLIDDYGHWQGARKAADEFLDGFGRPVLLTRTDYTGRMAVIPS